jgi:glycolate oxidase FAD binding subunit
MTQLTLKVLPRARMAVTLAADGLGRREAHAAMTRALGSHAEVSAAAHVPAEVNGGTALTLLRVAGFEPSVEARATLLPDLLRDHGALRRLGPVEAETAWDAVRHATPLGNGTLWRVNVPPSRACAVIDALEPAGARWLFDWGGGLLWLRFEGDVALVRRVAEEAGGHAALVRASAGMRARVPAQHPRAKGVMALEERVRRAFDPAGVFETGRFLDAN